MVTQTPAFTPIQPVAAMPVARSFAADVKAATLDTPPPRKKRVKAATASNGAAPAKKARAAQKPRPAKKAVTAKRERAMRVAPMQLDAAAALTAMLDMSRKDLETMGQMIQLLNPMSRPARLKLLMALQKVASQ